MLGKNLLFYGNSISFDHNSFTIKKNIPSYFTTTPSLSFPPIYSFMQEKYSLFYGHVIFEYFHHNSFTIKKIISSYFTTTPSLSFPPIYSFMQEKYSLFYGHVIHEYFHHNSFTIKKLYLAILRPQYL